MDNDPPPSYNSCLVEDQLLKRRTTHDGNSRHDKQTRHDDSDCDNNQQGISTTTDADEAKKNPRQSDEDLKESNQTTNSDGQQPRPPLQRTSIWRRLRKTAEDAFFFLIQMLD